MSSIRPFSIAVPDAKIAVLKQKLATAIFPDELSDAGWSMGTPLDDVRRLTKYWAEEYDWRQAEKRLNELPQFIVAVSIPGFDPLDIHAIHQRSQRPSAIPLLFVHGWPGSFYEVVKLLPLLTANADASIPSFHVVAPSLPNFGFSSGVSKKGFGMVQYAEAMHKVMLALGYTKYVTQGGDWGLFITRQMARAYPDHVAASHSNFPVFSFPRPWRNPLVLLSTITSVATSSAVRAGLARTRNYLNDGSAYLQLQDTRPQTLGYGLADSPVALLAWIYEKLRDWTDNYPWTDDEILTWVSIYAFSRPGPAASVRIYYEASHPSPRGISRDELIAGYVPRVPTAYAYFPKEIVGLPLSWAHTAGAVVQQEVYDVGGHFAAFEVPQLLAADLRKLFGRRGPCASIVPGHDGY